MLFQDVDVSLPLLGSGPFGPVLVSDHAVSFRRLLNLGIGRLDKKFSILVRLGA